LADQYKGNQEINGEYYEVEELDDGPRPFKAFLDVGLRRTTTGSRVFAALKGACDGGILIPHSERRFPGYSTESKELDAEVLRKYIFGGHVADYMKSLKEENEDAYKTQFSRFIAAGIDADGVEEMYQKAHDAIRANPIKEKKEFVLSEDQKKKLKKFKQQRKNLKQRMDTVKQKKEAFLRKLQQE
jgi:large subunit ribosomal protein L5e